MFQEEVGGSDTQGRVGQSVSMRAIYDKRVGLVGLGTLCRIVSVNKNALPWGIL